MSRPEITPKEPRMTLYAPVSGELAHILPQSVIVGLKDDDFIRLAFEGGKYSDMDFVEKLNVAAWRLSDRAPSVAVAHAQPGQVKAVATVAYDSILRGWAVEEFLDEDAATEWLGETPVPGGNDAQKQRAAGLIMQNGSNMGAMMAFTQAKAMNRDPVEAVLDYARTH